MTILEVDLGHVSVYQVNTGTTYTSIVKSVGLIINNESKLDTPITLQNRPQNNFFNVRKTGNTSTGDYILILSFEKM